MVSARSNLVGRLGAFAGAGPRDFSVGFRAAVAIELPGIANSLNLVEIQLGDEQFVLVAAGLLDDFAARGAEVAFSVKFADFPGSFGANGNVRCDEIRVGYRVRGLLDFPEVFGETADRAERVVDDFRAA